jgi:hypothetical protein
VGRHAVEKFGVQAGGHTDVTMTKRDLAAASSLSAKFGTPHPPLPHADRARDERAAVVRVSVGFWLFGRATHKSNRATP